MTINGKILFFNENKGKGIIISSNREKVDFFVKDWDDFDIMPFLGLEVYFDFENETASNIVSKTTYENSALTSDEVFNEVNKEFDESEELYQEFDEIDEESDESQEADQETDQSDEDLDEEEKLSEELEHEEILNEIEKSKVVISDTSTESEDDSKISKEEDSDSEDDEEEEKELRPENITLSLNLATAVSQYFDKINEEIEKRSAYKKVNGKINYLLAKRFIFTTFNNLTDLDLHIITPKIKMLNKDLREMSNVYDDFVNKTRYPHLAYKEVFLTCQSEYMKIKSGAEYTIEKLSQLRGNEKVIGADLEVKKEELNKNIDTPEFDILQNELKSLNGAYVDVVHMMAELDEKYRSDIELLNKFEDEYRQDFYELFNTDSIFFKKKLLDILDAQSYIFDAQLWLQARKSKAIKAYFKSSSINGGFNTKTYLKYYLDTQDAAKAGEETKKLFQLYDHLLTVQKDYILIVVNSVQDAMEYEASIKRVNKSYTVKSFINPKSALTWALTNSIKILIVEDVLQQVKIEKFLYIYEKNIFLKPKIILLGNKPKKSPYPINRLLSKNANPKAVAESVKIVIDDY